MIIAFVSFYSTILLFNGSFMLLPLNSVTMGVM